MVTGDVPVEDLERLGRLAGRSGGLTMVVVDGALRRAPAVAGTVVRVTPQKPFPAAWNAAMRAPGAARLRART